MKAISTNSNLHPKSKIEIKLDQIEVITTNNHLHSNSKISINIRSNKYK